MHAFLLQCYLTSDLFNIHIMLTTCGTLGIEFSLTRGKKKLLESSCSYIFKLTS